MAKTVIAAFEEFLENEVNLHPSTTARARSSRDWLLEQIKLLPDRHTDFPVLYSDVDLPYGSFARRTKIRELDDIDVIIGLSALGTTYLDLGGTVQLNVPANTALSGMCHTGTNFLNSRRVINGIVSCLQDVPQYAHAEIKRNGSAAVLNLSSYTWCFDIVPGFFTRPESDGRTYYIIPDGNGHWMKTDPRIDQTRVSQINQLHDGNVLQVIRLLKYWNKRPTMPSMPAYLIECIVLAHYQSVLTKATPFVDIEFGQVLASLSTAVFAPVRDPKAIQGDINTLSTEERLKISARATQDVKQADKARDAERKHDYETAIGIWKTVFGPQFSPFG